MKEVFNKFLNYSEKRDLIEIFEKIKNEKLSNITGYYNLPHDSQQLINEIESYQKEEISQIVVIGIGGSSLGTKAIYSFLNLEKEIIFLENPDPRNILNNLKKIKKETAKFIIISKSGKTIETISIFKLVLNYFNFDLKKDNKNFIVISDEGSNLCKFADEYKIKVYTIPHNVGGRFSVFSAVGIVPLTLAGANTKKILYGAREFEERFFQFEEIELIKKAFFIATKSYNEHIIFSYSNYLENFNKWYVQLLAESTGKINKENKNVGISPISLIGPLDQHSFLQLIVEGPRNKVITFIKVKEFDIDIKIPNISLKYLEETDFVNDKDFSELINKEAHSTFESVTYEKIPASMITLDSFDEEEIGRLMMQKMILTSLIGLILEIDTYNQPGVELSKKLLKEKFRK